MKGVHVERLSYQSALEWQTQWVQEGKQSPTRVCRLLSFEAEPVITMGIRARSEKDLISDSNLKILSVDRGGEATYHGPGQLVLFPVLHLPDWKISVREWVHLLLDVTKALLNEYEIHTTWNEEKPGLYTPKGKIAAIGLKIKNGWSHHGLALNVKGDLSPFSRIRACGVQGAAIDEMSSWVEARNLDMERLALQWEQLFTEQLSGC